MFQVALAALPLQEGLWQGKESEADEWLAEADPRENQKCEYAVLAIPTLKEILASPLSGKRVLCIWLRLPAQQRFGTDSLKGNESTVHVVLVSVLLIRTGISKAVDFSVSCIYFSYEMW